MRAYSGDMDKNDVSLREYVEQRFTDSDKAVNAVLAAQKEAIAAALAAQKEAVLKAENATEKRFEGVNEFRNTLADQQRTLMPRSETELLIKSVTDRMKILEDTSTGKVAEGTGAKNTVVWIFGGSGLVIGIITLLLRFMGK